MCSTAGTRPRSFAAVVEPELLLYSSDGTRVTDVIVSKSFANDS